MNTEQIQCLLRYLGYYKGNIDGIWGQQSRQATLAFQNAYMDGATGEFDEDTRQRILQVITTGEAPLVATGSYWDTIRHFRRDEPFIACPCGKCGGFPVEPDEVLMHLADRVREHFDAPMVPTSTVRCQAHNDSLRGSVKNSYHVRGKAMDFYIVGKTAAEVLAYVQTQGVHYAYAIDANAVHMDVN